MIRSSLLFCLFIFISSSLAWSDVITLQDGRIIEGEIVSAEDADPLLVRVRSGSIAATFSYPQTQIRNIQRGPSQRQEQINQLRQRLTQGLKNPDTPVETLWEIAQSFEEINDSLEFIAAVRRISESFPDFEPARQALGQERHEGEWLTEAEIKQRQGLQRYQGAWRSAEEVAQLQAQERAQEQERQARAEQQARRREERRAQRSRDSYHSSTPSIIFAHISFQRPYCQGTNVYIHHHHHAPQSGVIIGREEIIRW